MTIAFAAVMLAAQAMGHAEAHREALFLTDKMAYELGLNEAQHDAVYEINFDYLTYISSSKNVKGTYLNRRNYDINFVLTPMQCSKFYKADYFYTPVKWDNGVVLKVYSRYPDRSKMYYHAPRSYRFYRGEHGKKYNNVSWYKGKDFRSGRPLKEGRHDTGVGHGARPGHSIGTGASTSHGGHSIGHGAKPGNGSTGVGHGATIGTGASTNHGGHSVGTGAKPGNGSTGVGHGATIGTGASTNSNGIGHGVGTRSH